MGVWDTFNLMSNWGVLASHGLYMAVSGGFHLPILEDGGGQGHQIPLVDVVAVPHHGGHPHGELVQGHAVL